MHVGRQRARETCNELGMDDGGSVQGAKSSDAGGVDHGVANLQLHAHGGCDVAREAAIVGVGGVMIGRDEEVDDCARALA